MTTPGPKRERSPKREAYTLAGVLLSNEARARKKRFAPADLHEQEKTRELERIARYMRLAGLGSLKADTTRRPGVKRDRSRERRRR